MTRSPISRLTISLPRPTSNRGPPPDFTAALGANDPGRPSRRALGTGCRLMASVWKRRKMIISSEMAVVVVRITRMWRVGARTARRRRRPSGGRGRWGPRRCATRAAWGSSRAGSCRSTGPRRARPSCWLSTPTPIGRFWNYGGRRRCSSNSSRRRTDVIIGCADASSVHTYRFSNSSVVSAVY